MTDVNAVSVNGTGAQVSASPHLNKTSASSEAATPKKVVFQQVDFDPVEFNKAVEQIDKFLEANTKPRLSITVDETLKRPIVRLQDPDGGEIKTIPSEEVIRISRNIEAMKGVFFDNKS